MALKADKVCLPGLLCSAATPYHPGRSMRSRVTGELWIARPHRNVQAIQGIIQRLQSRDLQARSLG